MRCPLAALLFLSGCSVFDGGSSSSPSSGPNQYGYGAPTLELTINGIHFGPATPDSSSTVDVATSRDATRGQVDRASLSLHASSAAMGARCDFDLEKFGNGTTPLVVGTLQLAVATGTKTPDGTISPVGSPSVAVPQGSWSCGSCTGGLLVLSALDNSHVEGYLSGSFDSSAGAGQAPVICSFYLPMHSYSP